MVKMENVLKIKASQRSDFPHLKSISELKKMRLSPADRSKPDAFVMRHYYPNYYLYDVNEAVPYVCTEEEREHRRRQREMRRLAREQYTCLKCGSYQGELTYSIIREHQNGLCDKCYKEVNEQYAEKLSLVMKSEDVPDVPVADVIVLDIETTGLSSSFDEILSVSIVSEKGEVLLDEKVSPSKYSIWPEAYAVNKLTLNDLEGCKTIFELYPAIRKILSSAKTIIGYNHDFDLGFFEKMGIDTLACERVDVMKLFAEYYGEIDYERYNFKWKSLVFAAQYFGHTFDAHNSLEDVHATHFVYCKLKELMESGAYYEQVDKNNDSLAKVMEC